MTTFDILTPKIKKKKNGSADSSSSAAGGTNLAAVDVFVGDFLSTTELTVAVGAVDRYRRVVFGG